MSINEYLKTLSYAQLITAREMADNMLKEKDAKPLGYSQFKHANCAGCIKAGWQHWYVIYCTRPDIWAMGKEAEEIIGYAIHHEEAGPVYLEDMEPKFSAMRCAGVPATEHIPHQRFWARAAKVINISVQPSLLPCACAA